MFENEQALVDAGFVVTPNIFNSGFGPGKVYAKSFENEAPFTDASVEGGFHYDYYSVDPNGVVAPYVLSANVVATPVTPVVAVPVAEPVAVAEPVEEPVAEPSAE